MRKTYTPKAFASEQQQLPECWFEDENYPECSIVTFEEDQSKALRFMAELDPSRGNHRMILDRYNQLKEEYIAALFKQK